MKDIYTDGYCKPNPGLGGWGWISPSGGQDCGRCENTTNNRMELEAVIQAIKSNEGDLNIISDSKYVVDGMNLKWWVKWEKNGWRKSATRPLINDDLWKELVLLCRPRTVTFTWVRGHSGNEWNEKADALALKGAGIESPKNYIAVCLDGDECHFDLSYNGRTISGEMSELPGDEGRLFSAYF